MNYKKAYEEALERAKSYQKWNKSAVITAIFPELKESEDERIRKSIFKALSKKDARDALISQGVEVSDALAWIEKQGDKDKLIQDLGKYKVKYTQEVLEKHVNSMSIKDDERLRKTTIAFLKDFAEQGYENAVECIDWLKKQDELRSTDKEEPTDYNSIDPCFGKPIDNVEPKFKVGDWVVDNCGYTWKIEEILNQFYLLEGLEGGESRPTIEWVNKTFHLWTIEDAKDGDVLQFKGRPFIYNGYLEEKKYPFAYGGIYLDGSFFVSNGSLPWAHSDVYPATKEKRDFLFQKMKEAGYEWNAEKKELKKIERESIEWTEEDTNMFGSIRSTLSMYMNNLSLPKEIRDIHKEELKWLDELYDRGLS